MQKKIQLHLENWKSSSNRFTPPNNMLLMKSRQILPKSSEILSK